MNEHQARGHQGKRQRPLVLTVDDEPCIGRVVQLKLQNAGYDVVRANSGAEGLEKFVELRPDVLITDVKMPGMSGIELCARCEEYREAWPFLIIVLTSQLDEQTQAWLQKGPHRSYLPKPFSPREILRTVQEYMGRAGRQREPAAEEAVAEEPVAEEPVAEEAVAEGVTS
ncbi:MAG: response regulator [Planctomycetota bacterium]